MAHAHRAQPEGRRGLQVSGKDGWDPGMRTAGKGSPGEPIRMSKGQEVGWYMAVGRNSDISVCKSRMDKQTP